MVCLSHLKLKIIFVIRLFILLVFFLLFFYFLNDMSELKIEYSLKDKPSIQKKNHFCRLWAILGHMLLKHSFTCCLRQVYLSFILQIQFSQTKINYASFLNKSILVYSKDGSSEINPVELPCRFNLKKGEAMGLAHTLFSIS